MHSAYRDPLNACSMQNRVVVGCRPKTKRKKATDYVLLESLLTPAALVVAGCTTRAPSLASLDSFLPEIGPDKNHDRSLAE